MSSVWIQAPGTGSVARARVASRAHIAQIERVARRAFELSDRRLRLNPQPSSYSEALLALEALGRAQANYLGAISSYDKAQLRLMVLLGPDSCPAPLAPAVR